MAYYCARNSRGVTRGHRVEDGAAGNLLLLLMRHDDQKLFTSFGVLALKQDENELNLL